MGAAIPVNEGLTKAQWSILAAIFDAVIPSFTPLAAEDKLTQYSIKKNDYDATTRELQEGVNRHNNKDDALVSKYLAERATGNPEFEVTVRRLVEFFMPDESRKGLVFVLNALNTRAGALFLTGYSTPLDKLPVPTREKIIQGWGTARLALIRGLHANLTGLAKSTWLKTSQTIRPVLDCPIIPAHNPPPNQFFPFEFIQIPAASSGPETITADVVIVGSGCGGAVAAKYLAESGLDVVVVDKSYYWKPQQLPLSENEGMSVLFENGGLIMSDDSSMGVFAGSVWGGGGTINWSASLHTQAFVRREWAHKFDLPYFTTAAFQDDLDKVCERMGVGVASIEHNKGNRTLLEGARKLGFSHKVVPQNTGGEAHNCGYCTLGCGSCGKKGPTETFLPDAARAGARFLEGFAVEKVLFSDEKSGSDQVAAGVKGIWTSRDAQGTLVGADRQSREVIIKAPRVIVSGGTLASPLILKRSGLTNPHIGRHLHLHPASIIGALWEEDVRPWEGPILTSVVSEFENLDGEGYGSKLECVTMMPAVFLPALPWTSGLEFKKFAANMKRMTGYISIGRDRYGGRVYPDPVDPYRVRIAYNTAKHDRRHILEGIAGIAQIAYVEGALEIYTQIGTLPHFVRPASVTQPSISDPAFSAWLTSLLNHNIDEVAFASAHQMGSCRMGSTPSNSVVSPEGQVWGTKGLYVCDASVFPSASGVNPMITNMGISRGTARGIIREVSEAKGGKTKL